MLGSLLLGLAGLAQAQTSAAPEPDALLLACQQTLACKSHLDHATDLSQQERYDDAIEEYQAAYSLQPYPPILYNIARHHHKQKRLSEAIAYYHRYLDSSHPGRAELARQFLADAQQALAIKQSTDKPAPAQEVPAAPSASSAPLAPAAPSGLGTPVALAATSALSAALARPRNQASRPIYKRWWVWALIGTAAAGAATAISIGIYATGPDISGLPLRSVSPGR